MSGGGGGGDYQQQQAAVEAKKQAARDALNLQFGIAPSTEKPVATQYGSYTYGGRGNAVYGGLNGPVYETALQEWQRQQDAAAKNKASRDDLYSTVRQNAYDAGKRRLDEDQSAAKRNLKFELFAKGLDGGSVDVDQNALFDRTYNQGVIDLGAKADSVKNSLTSGDESTRLNLLQSIDAGMDQGSALSSAIAQMQNANDKAAAEATGTSIGKIFEGSGLLYEDSVRRKGQQKANQDFWSMFSAQPRSATSSGASGTITSTR